jgi:hypothetical protein
MSRKNSEIQGQASIFDQPPEEGLGVAEIPETPVKITRSKGGRWREGGPMDLAAKSSTEAIAAVPQEEHSVYNNVTERQRHLIEALRTISSQNSLGGYVYRGERDLEEAGPDSEPSKIWQQGGSETPFKLDAAAAKKDREENVPRREFERAIGLTAVQEAKREGKQPVMTESSINDYASKYYRKFNERYGGTGKIADRRRTYRKHLENDLAKRMVPPESRAA